MSSMTMTKKTAYVLGLLAASVLAAGCGTNAKKDDAKPVVPNSTGSGSDAVSAEDYAQLSDGVIIRVDSQGDSVGEMRATDADLTAIAPAETAQLDAEMEAAFAVGQAAKLQDDAASGDELDRDTSTQSWARYDARTNYSTYQPRAYLHRGGSYTTHLYRAVRGCARGRYTYYYYVKPRPSYPTGGSYPQGPGYPTSYPGQGSYPPPVTTLPQDYDSDLRGYLAKYGVSAPRDEDYYRNTDPVITLGRALFYDPILSGNGDTSCSTCHVSSLGTSNQMSLGPTLDATKKVIGFTSKDLLPRNSPSLYNRGHHSFKRMFWDSRIDFTGALPETPAGQQLANGLDNALAAQALFPLANKSEMLGCLGNASGAAPAYQSVWSGVLARVMAKPSYMALLASAYPNVPSSTYAIQHLANAIASYEAWAWRADQSPFDRYLRGESAALTDVQKRGATYFYGKGGCAECHSGTFQTDHQNHATAVPQFGPGMGDGQSGWEDWGWSRVTKNPADNFKFKTPSLRNVTLSGPWGHDGAWSSLKAFVQHYTDPVGALNSWDYHSTVLPFPINDPNLYAAYLDGQSHSAIAAANSLRGVALNDDEIEAILAFLHGLTDPGVLDRVQQGATQKETALK